MVVLFWESVIPALGSIISGAWSASSARRRADRANKYNAPANQVRLLREAGISPSMMFSAGGKPAPAVVEDAPKLDPTLGTAQSISAYQNMRALKMKERMDMAQMEEIETRTQGQQVKNDIMRQELSRFNQDRDLENHLKKIAASVSIQNADNQERITQARIDVMRRAQVLSEERFGFDVERFIVEQNLKERIFDLQKAKTRDDMRLAQANYLLDAARLAIQRGQLNVSHSQLSMAWKKYGNDYALMEAVNQAFEGNVDWKGIMKAGAKNVPRAVVQGLRRLIFGR